ncbi:MAG: L,D-transpeptidase family protein [Fimbriimonas sp.]
MKGFLASAFVIVLAPLVWADPTPVPGISFGGEPGVLYVPIRRAGEALGMSVGFADGSVTIGGESLDEVRSLPDGTRVAPIRQLSKLGARVVWDSETASALVARDEAEIRVRRGAKRVVIDKSKQELRALQGELVVLRSSVSTGRQGYRTPNGTFTAGPYKAQMHYSSLYNGAPMPYSVQIEGDIFVHGYSSVPDIPASHGCIRLPLDGSARFFYEWVEVGTPVTIDGSWQR